MLTSDLVVLMRICRLVNACMQTSSTMLFSDRINAMLTELWISIYLPAERLRKHRH